MIEAVKMADGYPMHLAHINAYCRGAIKDAMEETAIAIDLLKANPNIFCESYVSEERYTSDMRQGRQDSVQGDGELP